MIFFDYLCSLPDLTLESIDLSCHEMGIVILSGSRLTTWGAVGEDGCG